MTKKQIAQLEGGAALELDLGKVKELKERLAGYTARVQVTHGRLSATLELPNHPPLNVYHGKVQRGVLDLVGTARVPLLEWLYDIEEALGLEPQHDWRSNVKTVSRGQFGKLLEPGKEVTVVDWTSAWCGPCQDLAPVIDGLALTTQAQIVKVDIDKEEAWAEELGITCVPTVVIYRGTEIIDVLIGAHPGGDYQAAISRAQRLR